jgi:hypothetical protein
LLIVIIRPEQLPARLVLVVRLVPVEQEVRGLVAPRVRPAQRLLVALFMQEALLEVITVPQLLELTSREL